MGDEEVLYELPSDVSTISPDSAVEYNFEPAALSLLTTSLTGWPY